MLAHERLKEIVDYDSQTGLFRWRERLTNRVKIGDVVGSTHKLGYRQTRILGQSFWLHRLAWFYVYGVLPTGEIDHINGITSDNRIENLRIATHQQNVHNASGWKNASSPFKGVCFSSDGKRRKRWLAQIKHNGKWSYLGRFLTELEAHAAYDAAAKERFGEFARVA